MSRADLIADLIVAVIAACFGLLYWPRPAAAGTPGAPGPLTVRVYDAAGLSSGDLVEATTTAQRILAAAGVPTEWINCRAKVESCSVPLGPVEVAVRLVTIPVPQNYRGLLPMGDALIDTEARGGTLATIYTNRVAWLARAGQSDVRVLMGRAIAHEVGHLLLGTSGHAAHGLMRARWSEQELRKPVTVDWLFAPRDARHIREALAARSAPVGSAY